MVAPNGLVVSMGGEGRDNNADSINRIGANSASGTTTESGAQDGWQWQRHGIWKRFKLHHCCDSFNFIAKQRPACFKQQFFNLWLKPLRLP